MFITVTAEYLTVDFKIITYPNNVLIKIISNKLCRHKVYHLALKVWKITCLVSLKIKYKDIRCFFCINSLCNLF